MARYIDITHTVGNSLTVWPGDTPVDIVATREVGKGSRAMVSRLQLSSHAGTHMDAPAHFIEGADTIEMVKLEILIGDCVVVESEAPALDADAFDALDIPDGTRRLLIKTRNSERFSGTEPFFEDYVGVTESGARWIIEKGIALLGIDYMSVAAHSDILEVHHLLLGKAVVLLETLNLKGVAPGAYQLVALPLRLEHTDGSPVRAVLIGRDG